MADEHNTEQPKCRTFLGCGGCAWAAVAGTLFLLFVIALLLPACSSAREAARRCQCANNLKKIVVAMNSYKAKYGCYPPAYTIDQDGRPLHSWRTLLLEFLDHELYVRFKFDEPWCSHDNRFLMSDLKNRGTYYCPDDSDRGYLDTSYVMLVGPTAFSNGPTGRKSTEITDDPATTIIVVEMSHSGIYWTEPRDLNVSQMSFKINDMNQVSIRSEHSMGANVLFADGNVRYLNDLAITETLLKSLTKINGKRDLDDFSFD